MYIDAREQRRLEAQKFQARLKKEYSTEITNSINNTIVYTEKVSTPFAYQNQIDISVLPIGSEQAVFSQTEGRVAVLNFASFKSAGGGYIRGAIAQEEVLCAFSTLYPVLTSFDDSYYAQNRMNSNQGFYHDHALYSKDIVFFNKGESKKVDVITCASPNMSYARRVNDHTLFSKNSILLRQRIEFVLRIAIENNVDTIILGAFGCGVFEQEATEVASIFKESLVQNAKMLPFKRVIFAVPTSNAKSKYNHKCFADRF